VSENDTDHNVYIKAAVLPSSCHPISSAAAVSLYTVYFCVLSCFTLCPRLPTTHHVSSGTFNPFSLTHSLLPCDIALQCSAYGSNQISSQWYQALLSLPCCALYR